MHCKKKYNVVVAFAFPQCESAKDNWHAFLLLRPIIKEKPTESRSKHLVKEPLQPGPFTLNKFYSLSLPTLFNSIAPNQH